VSGVSVRGNEYPAHRDFFEYTGYPIHGIQSFQQRYREFVGQGIHEHELKFIRGSVQRNQLTGSEKFILEIEQRTGERILHRTRGRPRIGD